MKKTPKGLRLHIGIFGRRNVGKSSLLNAITGQSVSIVSEEAGTTTDPVEKSMELLPIGPVHFIDTAGLDDVGALGALRVQRAKTIIDRTDVAMLVCEAAQWGAFEDDLINLFQTERIPVIVCFNKTDIQAPNKEKVHQLQQQGVDVVQTAASRQAGIDEVKEALIRKTPEEYLTPPSILSDLVPPGEMAMLVVPIDLEAPKGRLILPQVQTIRDLLDNDAYCMVVKERELRDALDRLKRPPALIVTDSQAFLKVAGDTPEEIPMTSFSILFARFKGDLPTFVQGALSIEQLQPGDNVLIAEACSHHPIGEDIGRVKIPRWLTQYVGGKLQFEHVQGHDFPQDLSPYKLIIHCGSCTFNPKFLFSRIHKCRTAGVPITNYGIAIAYALGIFKRALQPFPQVQDMYDTSSITAAK
ncbi:MAG: [FeFe] hydrogenase H-cluster maturation GTPase HydF [Caldithrix sp.]|nr:[FeFe] hydrogenase H-cluster maturation GTPase HydF [Caldithrix sp.]